MARGSIDLFNTPVCIKNGSVVSIADGVIQVSASKVRWAPVTIFDSNVTAAVSGSRYLIDFVGTNGGIPESSFIIPMMAQQRLGVAVSVNIKHSLDGSLWFSNQGATDVFVANLQGPVRYIKVNKTAAAASAGTLSNAKVVAMLPTSTTVG